jgi:excinuclease UvrABC nuclease subunit
MLKLGYGIRQGTYRQYFGYAAHQTGLLFNEDSGGKIILRGQSDQLRNRVRSYFQSSTEHSLKTRHLVRDIVDIDWIVVGSELEASHPGNESDQETSPAV